MSWSIITAPHTHDGYTCDTRFRNSSCAASISWTIRPAPASEKAPVVRFVRIAYRPGSRMKTDCRTLRMAFRHSSGWHHFWHHYKLMIRTTIFDCNQAKGALSSMLCPPLIAHYVLPQLGAGSTTLLLRMRVSYRHIGVDLCAAPGLL